MKDDQTKGEELRSDDGDGLSFLLGLVFFSMMVVMMVMVMIISLSSVWGLGSILKSHGTW